MSDHTQKIEITRDVTPNPLEQCLRDSLAATATVLADGRQASSNGREAVAGFKQLGVKSEGDMFSATITITAGYRPTTTGGPLPTEAFVQTEIQTAGIKGGV